MSKFTYVIWSGTLQKSVIPVATIVNGDIKEEGKVTAKWRGQLYEAAIVKLDDSKSVLTSLMTEKTGRKRKLVGEKKTAKKTASDTRQNIEKGLIDELLQFEVPNSPPPLNITNTQQASSQSSIPMMSSQVSKSQVSLVSTSQAPLLSTSRAPLVSTSQAPLLSTSQAPLLSTSQAPLLSTSQAPLLSTSRAPLVSTSSLITASKTTVSSQAYTPPVTMSMSSLPSTSQLTSYQSWPSFPAKYPPPSSWIPLSSQSTSYPYNVSFAMTRPPPSSSNALHPFPTTYYPQPSPFEVYVSNTFAEMQMQLNSLDKRLCDVECRKGNAEELGNSELVPSAAGIGRDKMAAIGMILSNKPIGWKAALRKILITVFGATTLVQSCAVGKKNSNHKSLDAQTLDAIKDLLFQNYGGTASDFRPEVINTVINSACSGARRSLKCPQGQEDH